MREVLDKLVQTALFVVVAMWSPDHGWAEWQVLWAWTLAFVFGVQAILRLIMWVGDTFSDKGERARKAK